MPQPTNRLRATLAIAAVLGATLVLGVPGAHAGTWTQIVCAGGGPAPIDGMAPLSAGTAATATDRCDPAGGGLVALVSSATAVTPGTASSWTYTAPGSSTIAGGWVSLSLFAPGGLAYVATPGPSVDSADLLAACGSGGVCGGSVGGQLTAVVPISHPGGKRIYEIAECPGSCPAGGGGAGLFAQANVFGMSIELADDATPAGTAFGGGLLAAGVHGTQPLTFTATDPGGPGVFGVTATIDGKVVYNATPDDNGGHCAPVGKDAGGVNEWLYAQPCPASVAVSIPLDTTQFPDGSHALHVSASDAAGNLSPILDRTITIANGGAGSPGAENAVGGCPTPHLTAAVGSTRDARVALGGRASLHGVLTCAGRPLAGAAIEVSIGRRGASGAPATAELHTGPNGSFAYALAPGPSRELTVTYRTAAGASTPAASASARLDVTPSITLSIRPGRVRNGQTITYQGQVNGGYIPKSGLPLEIQYRDGHRWRTFDQTRARSKDGRFVYRYTFRRTTIPIVYTFRVVIPAGGVAGYPYASTGSRARSVRVDP